MSVAATEYFLALDGIKGESKAVGHVDEIDLEAFGWGEFAQGGGGAPGGGGGAGKVTMQDVHVAPVVGGWILAWICFLAPAIGPSAGSLS